MATKKRIPCVVEFFDELLVLINEGTGEHLDSAEPKSYAEGLAALEAFEMDDRLFLVSREGAEHVLRDYGLAADWTDVPADEPSLWRVNWSGNRDALVDAAGALSAMQKFLAVFGADAYFKIGPVKEYRNENGDLECQASVAFLRISSYRETLYAVQARVIR